MSDLPAVHANAYTKIQEWLQPQGMMCPGLVSVQDSEDFFVDLTNVRCASKDKNLD